MVLRAKEVDTLVLFGVATSGVVLSMLLEACDTDYRSVVITDCCADIDLELHRVLIERLFPLRGEVTTSAEFVRAVEKGG
jgi:nicotinamidase-related amidase